MVKTKERDWKEGWFVGRRFDLLQWLAAVLSLQAVVRKLQGLEGHSNDAWLFLYAGRPADHKSAGSEDHVTFEALDRAVSLIGSKPSTESPIASFFVANRPRFHESAPVSHWPSLLSAQRNSGFTGGGARGSRKDGWGD